MPPEENQDHIASLLEGDGADDDFTPPEGEQQQAAQQSQEQEQQADEQAAADKQKLEQQQEDQGKPPKGFVPYGALHEERMMRQQLQSQIGEMQQKFGQLQGLKDELESMRKASNEKSQAELEAEENRLMEEDPIEALRRRTERLQKIADEALQNQGQTAKQQEEQRAQQEQMLQMQNTVRQQVNEFTQENPDYPQAFQFILESRIAELEAMGYNNPAEIQNILNVETMAMAQSSMQRGVNPADAVYKLAAAKGYAKAAPQNQNSNQQGDTGTSLQEQMNRIERGQQAAQTLSGGGGSGKPGEDGLSLAEIEKMSEQEFDSLWADMEKSAGTGGIYE